MYNGIHILGKSHRETTEDDNQDFVFEEFVRLRVSGMDEGANETEA